MAVGVAVASLSSAPPCPPKIAENNLQKRRLSKNNKLVKEKQKEEFLLLPPPDVGKDDEENDGADGVSGNSENRSPIAAGFCSAFSIVRKVSRRVSKPKSGMKKNKTPCAYVQIEL